MPLHLLGKKSWNVYNADNIARVRQDEADAKVREEAERKLREEEEDRRRMVILRGEVPDSPGEDRPDKQAIAFVASHTDRDRRQRGHEPRRVKRRFGEDQTDYEMRVARSRFDKNSDSDEDDDTGGSSQMVKTARSQTAVTSSAPVIDRAGHFDLFGGKQSQRAAGRDEGDPDELRKAEKQKDRQAQRLTSDDPLAMMKRGTARIKELKREREADILSREREMRALDREERNGATGPRRDARERERRDQRDRNEYRHNDRSREQRHRHRRERDAHSSSRHRERHRSRSPRGERESRSQRRRRSRSPRRERDRDRD